MTEPEGPVVALCGRPNVGKSTLFNRLVKKKLALVHDEPGVTRDRNYARAEAFGHVYTLVDTGGFDAESTDPMKAGIVKHVKEAIAEAHAIVFVTDATTEPTESDRLCIDLLRKSNKPVFFAANKADSPKADADAFGLYRFGVDRVFPVSALHGRGIVELEEAFTETFPAPEEPEVTESELPRIAIVGRPNAGKSSLVNRLLGKDRMLVDGRPGTTRDAIALVVHRDGKDYVLVDTAGIRRKAKVARTESPVESLSVSSSIRTLERTDLAVLLIDAHEGVSEQDAKVLGLAEERRRGLVIALNKCDLLSKTEVERAIASARDKLSFAPYAPIVPISAKTKRGLGDLFRTIDHVLDGYRLRVTTGELNRFFQEVLELRAPPTMGGRAPRLYFITQAETRPPVFIAVSNAPESIHFSYQRFVVNQLRKRFGFEGVPIRVTYRDKRRKKKEED